MNSCLRAFVSLALGFAALAAGELGSADEYEIKAAMLLNLTRFVEWHAARLGAQTAPFSICILGRDPFGRDLDKAVSGKSATGHPIIVQRISDHFETCHILLVPRGERKKLAALVPALAGASVMTVGEGDKFAADGGVVGLVIRENRVQIEVNLTAAQRHGLVISSRLLRLVTVVKDGE